jgi:hypothetical protein
MQASLGNSISGAVRSLPNTDNENHAPVVLDQVDHASPGLVVTNLEALGQRPVQSLRLDAWLFEAAFELFSKASHDSGVKLEPLVVR